MKLNINYSDTGDQGTQQIDCQDYKFTCILTTWNLA